MAFIIQNYNNDLEIKYKKFGILTAAFCVTFGLADGVPGGAPPPPGIVTAAVTAKQNIHKIYLKPYLNL